VFRGVIDCFSDLIFSVKAKIEKTLLGQVSDYISEVLTPESYSLEIKLNLSLCQMLHLDIDAR